MMLEILTFCEVKPALNVLEIHPYFNQREVIDFHMKLGIDVASFCPTPPVQLQMVKENLREFDIKKDSGFVEPSK